MNDQSSPEVKRALPVAVSTRVPPEDNTFIKLQQGKVLWTGEPAESPEANWLCDKLPVDDIKAVLAPILDQLGLSVEQLEVKFLSEGEWNRVYLVTDTSQGREFVFRASLPVYPWYKTKAEVATIQFIRDNTTIPAPKVYAFDSSADNALGFEWILMEKLPGTQYGSIADYITMEENLTIAGTIAVWMDQLSRLSTRSAVSIPTKMGTWN